MIGTRNHNENTMRVAGVVALGAAATAALLLSTVRPSRSVAAVPGEPVVGEDDLECRLSSTLTFDADSAAVNLSAQSDLNRALWWLAEVPGRALLILGADGPRRADIRLGIVRANAAASFLIFGGVAPGSIMRGDFSELDTSRLYARLHPDNVVVMECEVSPVR